MTLNKSISGSDWTELEVELIVNDYFVMLNDELKGRPVNKTEHRKRLLALLDGRSEGSIEFKHQNISAALIEMGQPFIKGYKPRYNFQRTKLIKSIERRILTDPSITSTFTAFADESVIMVNPIQFNSWIVPPPELNAIAEPKETYRKAVKINFLEREQHNRDLGMKGELLVLQYEKHLLSQAGKDSLADSVEWVSKDSGDGLGFDILSKNLNGTDKYIEVKTTKLSKETPFFFSTNEYAFSKENSDNFHLYRLFNFNHTPKMFTLRGCYDQFCHIEPTQFRGSF